MILINLLDAHNSSPMSIYGNLRALAKRADLYSGDNFYFGFDSSNHTFLDIINNEQPLAIKHGPTLTLYQHSADEYFSTTFYIDVSTHSLLFIISIQAKESAYATFDNMLPWSFIDFYLQATIPPLEADTEQSVAARNAPEQIVQVMIEQVTTNKWPEKQVLELLPEAVKTINQRGQDIKINLADLKAIKDHALTLNKASSDCIVAPHNPFCDNIEVYIEDLQANHPDHITIRQIKDNYPRIEIISPKSVQDEIYSAVYERTSPELYQSLQKALNDPGSLEQLLKLHFPTLVNAYLFTNP